MKYRKCLRWLPFVMLAIASISAARAAERVVVSDVNGAKIAPLEMKGRKATVLLFITNDCPIANGYAPEIERIVKEYEPQQIQFYLVYVDGSVSAALVRKHRKDFGYTCPAVLDPAHKLVKLSAATVTPESAIFAPNGKRLYHGRIDDKALDFGKVRDTATTHDLRDALDAIVQGKLPAHSATKAVGCYIADLARK